MPDDSGPSRIEILEPVDSGLYGKVYKGIQQPLGRTVAVKIIKPELAHATDALSHAKALARIEPHPNVVTVFDVTTVTIEGIGSDLSAVVMEWIEGEKIGKLLTGPRIPIDDCRRIVTDLLDGLSHIHQCGMAHGDLNVGNIIVVGGNRVKIIDIDASKERSLGRLSTASKEAAVNADIDYCRGIVHNLLAHSALSVNVSVPAELAIQQATVITEIRSAALEALSARQVTLDVSTEVSSGELLTVANVLERATAQLRQNDVLGWKQLIRTLRQQVPAQLVAWRTSNETAARSQGDEWRDAIHRAIDILGPLTVAALVAIDSERPSTIDHEKLPQEIVSLSGWDRAGLFPIIDLPVLLGHVHHHLVGALLVNSNRHIEALKILSSPISFWPHDSRTPLWQNDQLMGWPRVVADECTVVWRFMVSLFERHRWLSSFFIRQDEYEIGLRGYKALASFLEYVTLLGKGKEHVESVDAGHLGVPTVFLAGGSDWQDTLSIERLVSHAIPNADVVDELCALGNVSPALFHSEWPSWYQAWLHNYHGLYQSMPALIRGRKQIEPPGLPHGQAISTTIHGNEPSRADVDRFFLDVAGSWALSFGRGATGAESCTIDNLGNYFVIRSRGVTEIRPKFKIKVKSLDVGRGMVIWEKIGAEGDVFHVEELSFDPKVRPITLLDGSRAGKQSHVIRYRRTI